MIVNYVDYVTSVERTVEEIGTWREEIEGNPRHGGA